MRERRYYRHLLAAALLVPLAACQPPTEPSLGASSGAARPATGLAAPLTDTAYEQLSVDEQYRVTNKLLATLYTGVPVADFYALESGEALRSRRSDAPTLATIRQALATTLDPAERARHDRAIVGDDEAIDENGEPEPLQPAFRFDNNRPKQMPLARITQFPRSRDAYTHWMAWHLANTILFSPAEEIDSADTTDVQNLFRRLELSIAGKHSIREIIATHQRTVENWRRFRSPEDNTREMMEIYLGRFDNDAEVPLASQACSDLYLTDERDGYKLARTDFPNGENVVVLDRPILDCNDFYDVVAAHPLVIARVVSVIVDHFFAGRPAEERVNITESIVASGPTTFEDVFTTLLFSHSYLVETERPKSFEESYLAMAARMNWDFHPDVLIGMTSGRGSLARTRMDEMGWSSLSLKLGRVAEVPTDSLSLANHHKALRETLMLDSKRWRLPLGLRRPDAPDPAPPEEPDEGASEREVARFAEQHVAYEAELATLDPESRQAHSAALDAYARDARLSVLIEDLALTELVDYLFLTAIQRRALPDEHRGLQAAFHAQGHLDEDLGNAFARPNRLDDIAVMTLDYLSRLPEIYYLPRLR